MQTDRLQKWFLVLHFAAKNNIVQYFSGAHKPYPWEYWPLEQGRSDSGYVGLVNLGATCYMATCVQQLFMIPAIRYASLPLSFSLCYTMFLSVSLSLCQKYSLTCLQILGPQTTCTL